MEDRRLDYYQPLLSVRRSPSPAPPERNRSEKDDQSWPKIPILPFYKSELKSGPIRNAGTVPFVWEQCPGKPKNESKSHNGTDQSPVIAPRLPPGRIKAVRKQTSEYSSASQQHKEVPFGLHKVSFLDEIESITESTKDVLEIGNSDTNEADEEYLDALDTSPRTESIFLNSSFSGISELDGSSVKTYGNFSVDLETRDLMMDRFLPAAKAMTSEAPQYAPRKQPMVQEQLTQMKVESRDKSPPLGYRPNVVPSYAFEEGEEESDDDYDDHGRLPAKACGLLPQLCLKGSFFPSNPLPGMRRRTQVQLSRTHGRSLYAASCCINENKGIKATAYRQKIVGDLQISKHEDAIESKNQLDQHNHYFPQKLEGSDLYRRVQAGRIPAQKNELLQPTSSQKPLSSYDYELPRYGFSEQRGDFSNHKEAKNAGETAVNINKGKGFRTFKELLADTNSNEEVDIRSPVIEKTLHVDIIHKVESPSMCSYSLEMKGIPKLNADTLKDIEKCMLVENNHSADSSHKDAENFIVKLKEDYIKVTAQKHVADFTATSLAERSEQVSANKLLKDSAPCRSPTKDLATAMKTEALDDVNKDSEIRSLNAEDARKPKENYSMFSSPPPLPKSPSDSWLSRTLPTIVSKAPSLQAQSGKTILPAPGNHTSNKSSADQKWATVVKSSRVHHRHEPLTSIPEI
ncbi:hypothetical protein DCAR_0417794 [Daucus carota subsp. sativus]|uniref:Uncharacterized protein n=1 Tax=Daucus carota subsp. sativus TaxID=79200 RepID=A0AAF0X0P2_DAUCS|nr:PREDICTED: uncharacterized protein LOC108216298 [Daucus carota subsp. sativus]WOG98451.1 hypothetical protein DCAR_0417794 [Daucus carota subsp. sativus]